MNCKNFYGSKRPGRERIAVNQGINYSVDNIHEDIPENDLSDVSDFSNNEDEDPGSNSGSCSKERVNLYQCLACCIG